MAGSAIRIAVLANASQAKREFGSTANAAEGMGSKIGKYGKMAGAAAVAGLAVAGAAALKFGADSVKSASDAQQSLGATETVFGKYADTVVKRSNDAAKSVGLSANEYRELANVMGASLAGAGIPLKKTAQLTDDINKRAADMAATFGGSTKEAVEAVGSLMRGEADPIERYGVSIKQTDVNARLAAKGQDKLTGSALKQAEMQARLDLLMQKTAKTQGAFGRESNTLAHQQQVLGAQFENIKAKVGMALLPILTKFLTFLNAKLGPAFTAVGNFIAPLVARFQSLFDGVGSGSTRFAPLVAAFQTFGAFVTGTLVPAITRLATYLFTTLAPIFIQVASIVTTKVIPIVASLARFFYGTLLPAIVTKVAGSLKPVFDQLVATFRSRVLPSVSKILTKFREWQPTIQKVIVVVVKVIGAVLRFAAAILGRVLPPVIRFAGWLVSKVVSAVLKVIGVVIKIIGWIVKFGTGLVNAANKAAAFATKVRQKIGDAVGFFRNLPSRISSAVGNLGSLLLNAGRNVVQGLINGINEKFEAVRSRLRALTNMLPDWKGPAEKDKRLLTPAGQSIIQGLIDGFDKQTPKVKKYLTALSKDISTFDASPTGEIRLSAAGAYSSAAGRDHTKVTVTLTAQQVSQLQRGREIQADLDAYANAGGRRST